jgi:hypothetical protein
MLTRIAEYETSDISVALLPDGSGGVLTLLTDSGRVSVHLRRSVLQRLSRRIIRELERVTPPSRPPKTA